MDDLYTPPRSSSKGRAILCFVLAALLLAGAIGCLFLYNAENEKTTLKFGYINSKGERVMTEESSGYLGGSRYVLSDEGRQIVLMMSIGALAMSAVMLGLGIALARRGSQASNRARAYAGGMDATARPWAPTAEPIDRTPYAPPHPSPAPAPDTATTYAAPRPSPAPAPTYTAPRPSPAPPPAPAPSSGNPWKKPGDL